MSIADHFEKEQPLDPYTLRRVEETIMMIIAQVSGERNIISSLADLFVRGGKFNTTAEGKRE